MSLTTLPTKAGYRFDGFYTDQNGKGVQVVRSNGTFNPYNGLVAPNLVGGRTLYANFVEEDTGGEYSASAPTYTVTYSCGAGDGTPPTDAVVTYMQSYTPAANTCSRTGYQFIGWTVDWTNDVKSDTVAFPWTYGEDKTLVAQWGHILHVGDASVYLRDNKKTSPAVHIKIGDDIFYGNMTTADVPMNAGTSRKLKMQYGNITYSVYDDTITLGG